MFALTRSNYYNITPPKLNVIIEAYDSSFGKDRNLKEFIQTLADIVNYEERYRAVHILQLLFHVALNPHENIDIDTRVLYGEIVKFIVNLGKDYSPEKKCDYIQNKIKLQFMNDEGLQKIIAYMKDIEKDETQLLLFVFKAVIALEDACNPNPHNKICDLMLNILELKSENETIKLLIRRVRHMPRDSLINAISRRRVNELQANDNNKQIVSDKIMLLPKRSDFVENLSHIDCYNNIRLYKNSVDQMKSSGQCDEADLLKQCANYLSIYVDKQDRVCENFLLLCYEILIHPREKYDLEELYALDKLASSIKCFDLIKVFLRPDFTVQIYDDPVRHFQVMTNDIMINAMAYYRSLDASDLRMLQLLVILRTNVILGGAKEGYPIDKLYHFIYFNPVQSGGKDFQYFYNSLCSVIAPTIKRSLDKEDIIISLFQSKGNYYTIDLLNIKDGDLEVFHEYVYDNECTNMVEYQFIIRALKHVILNFNLDTIRGAPKSKQFFDYVFPLLLKLYDTHAYVNNKIIFGYETKETAVFMERLFSIYTASKKPYSSFLRYKYRYGGEYYDDITQEECISLGECIYGNLTYERTTRYDQNTISQTIYKLMDYSYTSLASKICLRSGLPPDILSLVKEPMYLHFVCDIIPSYKYCIDRLQKCTMELHYCLSDLPLELVQLIQGFIKDATVMKRRYSKRYDALEMGRSKCVEADVSVLSQVFRIAEFEQKFLSFHDPSNVERLSIKEIELAQIFFSHYNAIDFLNKNLGIETKELCAMLEDEKSYLYKNYTSLFTPALLPVLTSKQEATLANLTTQMFVLSQNQLCKRYRQTICDFISSQKHRWESVYKIHKDVIEHGKNLAFA